jgi:hypothetical protein
MSLTITVCKSSVVQNLQRTRLESKGYAVSPLHCIEIPNEKMMLQEFTDHPGTELLMVVITFVRKVDRAQSHFPSIQLHCHLYGTPLSSRVEPAGTSPYLCCREPGAVRMTLIIEDHILHA